MARTPSAGPRTHGARAMAVAVVVAAVACWWLFAEPVESSTLWVLDEAHNHGLEVADVPALAALVGAAWLGLGGFARWRR